MNLCRSCGRDFSSLEAFDRHRVGVHAYTYSEGAKFDPPVEDGRRCVWDDELAPAGFVLDGRGRWQLAARAARARERLSGLGGSSRSVSALSGEGSPGGEGI